MNGLNGWDFALLGGAALAAVWRLVRMMRERRDRVVADVQRQIDEQRARKKEAPDQQSAA